MTKTKISCTKNPYPLGAAVTDGMVHFSFCSKESDCGVLIFDRKSGKRLRKLPFSDRVGNVHFLSVQIASPESISYLFYERDRVVADPYAKAFSGKKAYGRERRISDLKALILHGDYDWEDDVNPLISYRDSIVYCAHVRGFTRHSSSGVEHRGTFRGMTEKIDYLRETGITAVELQPVYEFIETPAEPEGEPARDGKLPYLAAEAQSVERVASRCNYWGYKEGYYYAPKAGYAAGNDASVEFKDLVKAFHKAGMEVILQFYFPNSVNVLKIPDILKFWVLEYHVDGFHLMGERLPVETISTDALLSNTKIWYDYFQLDKIYENGEDPEFKNLGFYSDDYMYTFRKFLKGDENMLGAVAEKMRGLPERAGRIHYMSNYHGFTLMDMVSYDRKHNEDNGEDNRDGNDFNCSWNCGEEGSTRRKKILALRFKQIKNAYTMLLMTQSTPLIFMGDEFGRTQKGNNNPYCQDNAVTWLNWNDLTKNRELYDYFRMLIGLRKEHPILRPEDAYHVMDTISCGYPDLSYHGESAWRPRFDTYFRHIGMMYCGKYAKKKNGEEDDFFYLAFNMYWKERALAMPKLPAGLKWKRILGTEECGCHGENPSPVTDREGAEFEPKEHIIHVPGRSCQIFMSVPSDEGAKKRRNKGKKHVVS